MFMINFDHYHIFQTVFLVILTFFSNLKCAYASKNHGAFICFCFLSPVLFYPQNRLLPKSRVNLTPQAQSLLSALVSSVSSLTNIDLTSSSLVSSVSCN